MGTFGMQSPDRLYNNFQFTTKGKQLMKIGRYTRSTMQAYTACITALLTVSMLLLKTLKRRCTVFVCC